MMKKYYLLIIVSFCLYWLAGCKVSKNISIPIEDAPATYRNSNSDSATVADVSWQTFFADSLLLRLIATALQNNFDLQDAVKNIDAARLVLQQAKLGNLPSLDMQAGASYNRPSDNSLSGQTLKSFLGEPHVQDYSVIASFSWEADVWGKIKNRKASALASYLQTEEAHKAVQTTLISNIAKGYYDLLRLDAALQIAYKNISLNDSTIKIAKWQYDAGQVTSLALQQTLVQQLIAKALVPQFEQAIVIQENSLCILTGRQSGKIQRTLYLDSINIAGTLHTGFPLALLSRRPDIKLTELDLDKANASVGFAKANLYPSITITAQGGLDALRFSNWFTMPTSLFGAVAGSFTQPLFRQKALQTQYKVSLVNREQAVIRFRKSILMATGEVSDALVTIEKLELQQQLVAQRASALALAIRNARLLFSNGMATYLEVITASANALQTDLEMISIKTARLNANVDLYRSLGGGLN